MANKRTTTRPASRFPIELTPDRIIIGGTILGTVIILAVIVLSSINTGANLNRVIEGVEVIGGITAGHQEANVNYRQTPPAGGIHHPVWQTCGVYTEQIRSEHAVHSLEHGAIWITYQPGLPADQLQILQDLTRRSTHRLLSPFPGIDSPIILTAWGYQLRLEDVNDARIGQFIAKYEQGPSTPERGAVCSGGETRTLREIQ